MELQEEIPITCPYCEGKFKFPKEGVGMMAPCPHCSQEVRLVFPKSPPQKQTDNLSEVKDTMPQPANLLLAAILVVFLAFAFLLYGQVVALKQSVEVLTKPPVPIKWHYDGFTLYNLDPSMTQCYLVKIMDENEHWSAGESAYNAAEVFEIIGKEGWELAWREQTDTGWRYVVRRSGNLGANIIVSEEPNPAKSSP